MVTIFRDKKRNFGFLLSLSAQVICMVTLAALLTSCGNNEGYSYTVRGTVTGMVGGGLVLQNNGTDDQTVAANGAFVFGRAIPTGGNYSVTIKTLPPAISQTCVVLNGTGAIQTAPINSVVINCVAPPPRLVVNPLGTFAYASNFQTGNVSAFAIDSVTGNLIPAPLSPIPAGTNPNSVTIDPSGNFVYVANLNSNDISGYTIDPVTGDLAPVPLSPFAAGTTPYTVAIIPSTAVSPALAGKIAYVPNVNSNNISAYLINPTGSLTELVGVGSPFAAGANPSAITVDPTGSFAYVSNTGSSTISVYAIDQATGALVAGTPAITGVNPTVLAIDPLTKFAYVANTGSNSISFYVIDPLSGNLTTGLPAAAGVTPNALTMVPTGKFAYSAGYDSNIVAVYIIDQTAGTLTAGTTVLAGTNPYGFSIIPATAALSGQYAYVPNFTSNNISVYAIDQTTGALNVGTAVAAGTKPYAFTIAPTGLFAYALNAGSNNISVYIISQTTGALDPGTPPVVVPLP